VYAWQVEAEGQAHRPIRLAWR